MTTKNQRRSMFFRRQLLIDKPTQISILLYTMFVALTTLCFIGALVMLLQYNANSPVETDNSSQALKLIAVWVIAMLLLTFLGVYVTNKTAGPIYRLRKSMQSVANGGSATDITFRKGDHFYDLAADYNKVLERLRIAESKK